jgi:hypothetical protein
MAHNMEWEDCVAHITIHDVKITLQFVRGCLASCNNFQTTIRSFYSWIWIYYKTLCDEISNKRQCEIRIENFSTWTCMNVVIMLSSSSGKWEK